MRRPARSSAAALPALLGLAACATTLEAEARRAAESGLDPAPLVAALAESYDAIDETKRIFAVTLIEGRRRFGGEGALTYRADPRRLEAHVFGPHDTPILHVLLDGATLTVTLPREGETLTGPIGDPRFAALTGERALVSPEILGALLGAYDARALTEGADAVLAAADGARRTLYVRSGDAVHALTLAGPSGPLVEYRQARAGRAVLRVEFSEFRPVGARSSPRHVVLRDYARDRRVVVDVRSEREEIDATR